MLHFQALYVLYHLQTSRGGNWPTRYLNIVNKALLSYTATRSCQSREWPWVWNLRPIRLGNKQQPQLSLMEVNHKNVQGVGKKFKTGITEITYNMKSTFLRTKAMVWTIIEPLRRYLLKALDMFWHEDCLKCGCCDCRLGEVGSTLYTKGNLILCKRDYLRSVHLNLYQIHESCS